MFIDLCCFSPWILHWMNLSFWIWCGFCTFLHKQGEEDLPPILAPANNPSSNLLDASGDEEVHHTIQRWARTGWVGACQSIQLFHCLPTTHFKDLRTSLTSLTCRFPNPACLVLSTKPQSPKHSLPAFIWPYCLSLPRCFLCTRCWRSTKRSRSAYALQPLRKPTAGVLESAESWNQSWNTIWYHTITLISLSVNVTWNFPQALHALTEAGCDTL